MKVGDLVIVSFGNDSFRAIIVDQDEGDFKWVSYHFEEHSIWYADDHEVQPLLEEW